MRAGSRSSARNAATACCSASAALASCVSDRTKTANASPAPVRSSSCNSRRSGGSTRRMSSSRTVIAIAVRGSVAWSSMTGDNVRIGSRRATRMRNPMRPFARHSPVHGAVPVNATSITSFATVQPPGASTCTSSVPRPRPVNSAISATTARRNPMLGSLPHDLVIGMAKSCARGADRHGQSDIGISFVFQCSCHCPPDRVAVIDAITRPDNPPAGG